jgi:hypothetical protein
MKHKEIQHNAELFVATYHKALPEAYRNAKVVAQNWSNYPAGAGVPHEIKRERILQTGTDLLMRKVPPALFLSALAVNPTPLIRPDTYFVEQFDIATQGFASIGHPEPHLAWLRYAIRASELLSYTGTQIGGVLVELSDRYTKVNGPKEHIVESMQREPALLPLLAQMGATGVMMFSSRLHHEVAYKPGKNSTQNERKKAEDNVRDGLFNLLHKTGEVVEKYGTILRMRMEHPQVHTQLNVDLDAHAEQIDRLHQYFSALSTRQVGSLENTHAIIIGCPTILERPIEEVIENVQPVFEHLAQYGVPANPFYNSIVQEPKLITCPPDEVVFNLGIIAGAIEENLVVPAPFTRHAVSDLKGNPYYCAAGQYNLLVLPPIELQLGVERARQNPSLRLGRFSGTNMTAAARPAKPTQVLA